MNRRSFILKLFLGAAVGLCAGTEIAVRLVRQDPKQRAIDAMIAFENEVFRLLDDAKIDVWRIRGLDDALRDDVADSIGVPREKLRADYERSNTLPT